MSHYAVAVIHRPDQLIGDLLAPYDENLEVKPYIRYTRQSAIVYVRSYYKDIEGKTEDELWHMLADDYGEDMVDEDGNIYSTYNPKSKWDWYCVGGRFSDMMRCIGSDEPCNECLLCDLDVSRDEDEYQAALHFWDVYVDETEEDPEVSSMFRKEYYLEYYGDRETYARRSSMFATYAVVTPDGEWHAPGDVGWWGVTTSEADEERGWYDSYYSRFIDTDDKDLLITIVDCHI